MKMKLRVVACACIAMASTAVAQVSIDDLVSEIVDNSPALQSQMRMLDAQRADNSDANSLANPSVEFARVWGRHGIGNKLQLDVSQEFEWPGVYRLRSRVATMGITAAELAVIGEQLDIALEAKLALVELVYVRRQIEMLEDLKTSIDKLKEIIDASAKSQEVTIIDIRKAEFEQYKLVCQITNLKAQESELMGAVQQLCPGHPLDFSIVDDYPSEPLLSREQYIEQMNTLDPFLAEKRATADQEALNAKLASQQRMPNLSVGYQHQAEMGDRFNGFTVGVTLPFFENRKARGAALARQEAANIESQALADKNASAIDNQLSLISIWSHEMAAYLQTLRGHEYLTLVEKAYAGGEMSVLDYITELQYFQESTLTHIECEYNYQKSLATLNKYRLLR